MELVVAKFYQQARQEKNSWIDSYLVGLEKTFKQNLKLFLITKKKNRNSKLITEITH
jgi:hypothetical protein